MSTPVGQAEDSEVRPENLDLLVVAACLRKVGSRVYVGMGRFPTSTFCFCPALAAATSFLKASFLADTKKVRRDVASASQSPTNSKDLLRL